MTLAYVATPAIFGLLTMALTAWVGVPLWREAGAVRVSLWLGAGQVALVVFSVWQTYERSISRTACLTAIFGFMGMAVVAALDVLSLGWWLWSRRGEGVWPGPVLFVVLRAVSHGLLTAALLWHGALCTV